MSGSSPLWRGILWAECFLPRVPTPPIDPSPSDRRKAALVPALIYPLMVLPVLVGRRHQAGAFIGRNLGVAKALALVIAGGALLAIIGFGLKAWHDAKGTR